MEKRDRGAVEVPVKGEKGAEERGGGDGEVIERGDDEDEEQCEEQEEAGKRNVKNIHDPKLPSKEEVKEHYESGHMPYRSWCHHCVRGRGRERDHQRRSDQDQQGIPEYHLDYCFPRGRVRPKDDGAGGD